jgi:hypothetical protein
MVLTFIARSFPKEFGAMRVESSMNPIMQKEKAHGKDGDTIQAGI